MTIARDNLFSEIRLILIRDWDPIGVKFLDEFSECDDDEYDGYAREITSMVIASASKEKIEEYLRWSQERNIGLPVDNKKIGHVAEKIFSLLR